VWETILTTLLLTLIILCTLWLERSSSYSAWIGYGFLWSLTALTSAATLATLPFLGLWILVRQRRNGISSAGPVLAASLAFLMAVTPWIWRSSRTYGRFVAFRGNAGLEVMVGNSDDTSNPSNWKVLPGENRTELEKLQRIGEPLYMAEKQREAKETIVNHPLRFAGQSLRRILFSWTNLWGFPPHWTLDASGAFDVLTYSSISLLAFLGVSWMIRSRWDYAVPLLVPLVFFPVVYYLTHEDVRFRHPIDPEVVIFAVCGVFSLLRQDAEMLCEDTTFEALEESTIA
jgi:hypothetical protein